MPYNIGETLKKYRSASGITVKQISEILTQKGFKASEKTIYSRESGNSSPSPDALLVMCKAYGINDVLTAFGYDGYNEDGSLQLDMSEINMIEKYRNLDDYGRQHVDELLNWEEDRVKALTHNEKLMSQQAQYIAELEKLASMDCIPMEPCRAVCFYQTYPSPATGKVMWDDIKIDNTEIPDNDENKEGDYLITMDDDSMAPLFWRTDILLVKETNKIELGEIGVFTLNGVCYIKELGKNKLISRNPDFPPIMFDKSLECKGKVLRNLMEHTEDEIKYLTERKDHIRRYQETYQMVAENGLNDDDETRKLVQKIVDSLKETPDSND